MSGVPVASTSRSSSSAGAGAGAVGAGSSSTGHDRSSSNAYSQGGHGRRVPSTSSVASSGTAYSSARGSYSGSQTAAHLETTVTKLLVATKQLLEGLTDWSQGRISEEQVSDIYVRLGNCFNAAVSAFTKEGISMRDLKEIPQLLRVRLEAAINEEASRDTLNEHLPKIRPIVLDLLRGLRQKQEQHASMMAANAAQAERTSSSVSADTIMQPPPQRRSSTSQPGGSDPSISQHRQGSSSGLPHSRSREELAAASSTSNGRISPAPSGSGPPSRPSSRNTSRNPVPTLENDLHDAGRRTPQEDLSRRLSSSNRPGSHPRGPSSARPPHSNVLPPEAPLPPLPATSRAGERPAASSGGSQLLPSDAASGATPSRHMPLAPLPQPPSLTPSGQPSAFSTPPRSTLRPMPSTSAQGDDASLEALKKADPLARRASKRFSAYTFSKISSSTSIAGSPGGSLPSGVNGTPGRSTGMERDSSARDFVKSGGRMDALSDEEVAADRKKSRSRNASPKSAFRHVPNEPVPALPPMNGMAKLSLGPEETQPARKKRVSVVQEETDDQLAADTTQEGEKEPEEIPRPPTIPEINEPPDAAIPSEATIASIPRSASIASLASSASQYSAPDIASLAAPRKASLPGEAPPNTQTVFLQLGRDVKKTTLDISPPPTIASLRMLFTDKFAYNPGLSDFPAIYLRDAKSGIQYELEDVSEIQEHSILSLNIEPLDQVKQHIDEGLASLARELKDLKQTFSSSKRASIAVPNPPAASSSPGTVVSRPMPSDAQFQTVAQDFMSMKRKLSAVSIPSAAEAAVADLSAKDVASPAPSTASASEAKVMKLASDLRSSFDEIQSVRRDVGVLRQVYLDFRTETASVLGALKTQTSHVKELANTKIAGSRAFIDEGKVKLDNRSQDLLTKIEELQDTIDDLKNDVTTRKIKPKPRQMQAVKATIAASQKDLDDLQQYIATTKPMWKKTWEAELQNIVEEQQLLNHQEELLSDLQADHENVVTIFDQIQQYVALQNQRVKKHEFRPPSPDVTHEGLSTVMLEVKGLEPASDKRMKAIQQAEKMRQKEAASKTNDFSDELSGFVEGRKLKKTGGAEETERLRQIKSEASLKAMFASSGSVAPSPPPPVPSVPQAPSSTSEQMSSAVAADKPAPVVSTPTVLDASNALSPSSSADRLEAAFAKTEAEAALADLGKANASG